MECGGAVCQEHHHYSSNVSAQASKRRQDFRGVMRIWIIISRCLSASRKNNSLDHLHLICGKTCLLGLAPQLLLWNWSRGLLWAHDYSMSLLSKDYLEMESKFLLYYHCHFDSMLKLTVSKMPKALVQENIQPYLDKSLKKKSSLHTPILHPSLEGTTE